MSWVPCEGPSLVNYLFSLIGGYGIASGNVIAKAKLIGIVERCHAVLHQYFSFEVALVLCLARRELRKIKLVLMGFAHNILYT